MKKWDGLSVTTQIWHIVAYSTVALLFFLVILVIVAVVDAPDSNVEPPEKAEGFIPLEQPKKPFEFFVFNEEENAPPSAEVLRDIEKLRILYKELQGFKDDPKFHEVFFGFCCRFGKWAEKVDALRSKITQVDRGKGIIDEVGFFPGLRTLAYEYRESRGHTTTSIKRIEEDMLVGLAPKLQPKEGQGVITMTDRACADMDTYRQHREASEDWIYADAEQPISVLRLKAGNARSIIESCSRIIQNMVVDGPLASKNRFYKGASWGTYHQVKIPDGTKVWVNAYHVEFKSKHGTTAFKACKKIILDNADFPSKADVPTHLMNVETWGSPMSFIKTGQGELTVKGEASIMNASGDMRTYDFHCKVFGGEVTSLERFPS